MKSLNNTSGNYHRLCFYFWTIVLVTVGVTCAIASNNSVQSYRIRHERSKRQDFRHRNPERVGGGAGSYVNGDPEGGPWGSWEDPTECSRPCGGGVSTQSRTCLESSPDSQSPCYGSSSKHFSCNIHDCPEGTPDFRSEQCSQFNEIPFEERYYDWIPYNKAPDKCELNCMPRGERFYYRHKEVVADGTRCNDEGNDICVGGQCLTVGCDMMLGSTIREDKCRECGGDGTNCNTVNGIIDLQERQVGYNDLLLIPAGSTNIIVKERTASNNYLAIRNVSGHYYLNGNWQIVSPREVKFAGSIFHYERKPHGFFAPETIRALGPITEAIYIVVLYQEPSPGIEYEYSIPRGAVLSETDTYEWGYGEFGNCTSECGGGTQRRIVRCEKVDSKEAVPNYLCDPLQKPLGEQSCNTQPCSPKWRFGDWSPCKPLCGNGTQSRNIHCEQIVSASLPSVVQEEKCLESDGEKPVDKRECSSESPCPSWFTGRWKPCSHLCGDGTQQRQVICHMKEGGRVDVLQDGHCQDEKPPSEKSCYLQACEGVDWIAMEWTGCDKCGTLNETRRILCATQKGEVFDAEKCHDYRRPVDTRSCDDYNPCEHMWYATEWSHCSSDCGPGMKNRRVFCGKTDEAGSITKVSDDKCDLEKKYHDEEECVGKEICEGTWFTGPWGKCSKKCGGGDKTRKTFCLTDTNEVDASKCSVENIPFTLEGCNSHPCGEDEVISVESVTILEEDDEECIEDEDYDEVTEALEEVTTEFAFSSESGSGELETEETGSYTRDNDTFLSTQTSFLIIENFTTFSTEFDNATDITTDFTTLISLSSDGFDINITDVSPAIDNTTEETRDFHSSTEIHEASTLYNVTDVIETETSITTDVNITSEALHNETMESSQFTLLESSTFESPESTLFSIEASTFESSALSTLESTSSSSSEMSESSTFEATESSTFESTESSTLETTESSTLETTESSTLETTESSTLESTGSSTLESTESSSFQTSESSTFESTTDSENASKSTLDLAVSTEGFNDTTSEGSQIHEYSSTDTSWTQQQSTILSDVVANTTTIEIDETSDWLSRGVTLFMNDTGTEVSTNDSLTTDIENGTEYHTSTIESSIDNATMIEDIQNATHYSTTTMETLTVNTTLTSDFTETDLYDLDDITDFTDTTETGLTSAELAFTKELELRKCKPRKKQTDDQKRLTCWMAVFGCCFDNSTVAKGPFLQGCPNPETCEESQYGCCPDGVSAAEGSNNAGCPEPKCEETLFGCCPDGKKVAEGNDEEGCEEACVKSRFGCCSDGIMEATGPNKAGCEADKKACESSQFGCCPDGTTVSRGKNNEGCDLACPTSHYGCCDDGETPSHGPNKEGCCLNTQFGCCPDNIIPAQGPSLQGCGCQYSPYSCCPDNETAARGPNNEGCGCKYTSHGCCQDGYTPALGENFLGCPCGTFQHGCCSDGTTIARGPNQEGCGCEYKDYGCCPDQRTPAKGPSVQDCSCESSRFGCCPDGATEAQGDKFESCENVPPTAGEICSQGKERGSCRNFTVQWFFDMEYGGCSRFWYGGCNGNTNRFSSQEECNKFCVDPPTEAACTLPQISGPCEGYYPSWHYNQQRKSCVQFIYGGCLGNKNRYETKEECELSCQTSNDIDVCEQTKVTGPCNGNFTRWNYDKNDDWCKEFTYGGCKANGNNFLTERECHQRCRYRGRTRDVCLLSKEEGPCEEKIPRWFFDILENRCAPFYYAGCGGNANNFDNIDGCERTCPSVYVESVCKLPAVIGPCRTSIERWYFDSADRRCKVFVYGGCGGNANNFITDQECQAKCSAIPGPIAEPEPVSETTVEFRDEYCFLPQSEGSCNLETSVKLFYDTRDGVCKSFTYTGCGGNENRFSTIDDCQRSCSHVQDICILPRVVGPCSGNYKHWYYELATDSCYEFDFGGCQGNHNRFPNKEDCDSRCKRHKEPEIPDEVPSEVENEIEPLEPIIISQCAHYFEECIQLQCAYGLEKLVDENNCERCRCRDPCFQHVCPEGARCIVELVYDEAFRGTNFRAMCRQFEKEGVCPSLITGQAGTCQQECQTDADCASNLKCCSNGCGSTCISPATETHPDENKHQRPPQPDTFTDYHQPYILPSEQEVQEEEGGVAVLSCEAGGQPKPTVTWWKNVELKHREGRYLLAENGSLKIIGIDANDAGVYTCMADNGIGTPAQKLMRLTVTGPTNKPADIVGDQPFTIISLGSPAVLRCYAVGWPRPSVTWWRADRMLPLSSERYEQNRDFSLMVRLVALRDLGPYTCQAYNGMGKATSWTLTLQAIGPVYSIRPEDANFTQFIVEPSKSPFIPPAKIPVTTTTTPEPTTITTHLPLPSIIPVTAQITMVTKSFPVGADVIIPCHVEGYPVPYVKWYKDSEELSSGNSVKILGNNSLLLEDAQSDQSGKYRCEANNEYNAATDSITIHIDGINLHPNCTDNPFFANCKLIVRAKYCTNKYYARFCCQSCTLAGQLPVYGPHLGVFETGPYFKSNKDQ